MSSTPPVVFKRTKAKPAQRTRPASPEAGSESKNDGAGDDLPFEVTAKLKSKAKKAKQNPHLSFGGPDDDEGTEEVFKLKKSKLSQKLTLRPKEPENVAAITTSSVRSAEESTYESVKETLVPTETSIKTAKETRERLRKTGISTNEDFISLSVTRRSDFDDGPHPESRLVREEDELGEGDDEYAEYTNAQERIALGKKSRKAEATKRRDEMKELIADVEDQDEETMEWEQEQLRRGGHQPSEVSEPKKKTYQPALIPASTPLPILGDAISRLTQQLSQLTASHASDTSTLNSLAQQRAESDVREKELREMVAKAEEKRAWFESFKDWVEGVANFLDEKYPLLEKLEDEHVSLARERFDIILKRRQEDDQDDLSAFMGEPTGQPEVGNSMETDEFGREVPKLTPVSLKHQRRAARLSRRRRRQGDANTGDEGYSTDASLPPDDAMAYEDSIKSLSERAVEVLSDVKAEEFQNPGKGRWATWRQKYADSYINAWGGLGVVSVWEFWTRLEVVGWDCVETPRSLHSFRWYQGLYEYSRPGTGVIEERDLGPDGDLVSSMITTAVIPRICKLIEGGALNVYSDRHIRRMVDLAEEIEASIEADNLKLQSLFKAVIIAFEDAVTVTEELVGKYQNSDLHARPFDPEAIPARQRFIARRVKLLQNLHRWRKYTGECHGIGALIVRVLTAKSNLLHIMKEGWEVGGREVSQKLANLIKNAIPEDLYREMLHS